VEKSASQWPQNGKKIDRLGGYSTKGGEGEVCDRGQACPNFEVNLLIGKIGSSDVIWGPMKGGSSLKKGGGALLGAGKFGGIIRRTIAYLRTTTGCSTGKGLKGALRV